MTSEARRNPTKDHLLTPENSVFIIIDYQAGAGVINSIDGSRRVGV